MMITSVARQGRVRATAQENTAATADAARTLAVAASGTMLVLAVFSAVVTTVGDSARSLHMGIAGETWVPRSSPRACAQRER